MKKGRRTGGARMTAVVTLRPGQTGRHYRLPTDRDYEAVRKAQKRVARILEEWERGGKKGLCPVPDEPLPPIGTHRLPCAALRHAPVGRPLHGPAEGGAGGVEVRLTAFADTKNSSLALALTRSANAGMSGATVGGIRPGRSTRVSILVKHFQWSGTSAKETHSQAQPVDTRALSTGLPA